MRNKKIILLFTLAFLLRLGIVFSAHHGDLNNNISWGTLAVERGLSGFYEGKSWPYSAPNQPPLSILTFATTKVLWQWAESAAWWLNRNIQIFPSAFIWFWEGKGMDLMVKLPGIFADLGIAGLIYQYLRYKKKEKLGIVLSAVWLFNPVSWYNSAVWGQTDAIVNLFGLVSILFLLRKRLVLSFTFLALSLLFKGSLAIFVPIFVFVAFWQKRELKEWVKAVIAVLTTVVLVSIWFHPRQDLLSWLFSLYQNRILPGEIGYLTANAFNFWWLVDPGKVLDSTIYFGLPARAWGFMLAGVGVAWILLWLRKGLSDKYIFLSFILISLISFLFMTRIHERYLYPFFPYATILLGLIPNFAVYYIILSATYLLNLYHLFWAPSIPFLEALYTNVLFPRFISVVNLFFLWYLLRHLKAQKV